MEKSLKSLTDKYFSNVFFWWFGLVLTIHMYCYHYKIEGLFKYGLIVIALYSAVNFSFSIYKIFNFFPHNDKTITTNDILKDILPPSEFKQRSIFNYLNHYPAEQPFILLSVIGLIITELYTGISGQIYQWLENIPFLNIFFPNLFLVILLMIFSDYTYHIKEKYIRRPIKFVLFIYSPIIISFFLLGLFGPAFLVISGLFKITSIQDIKLFFTSFENLYWLILYPWTIFFLLKCSFRENQQMIEAQ